MELKKEEVEMYNTLNDKIQDFGNEVFRYILNNAVCLLEFGDYSVYDYVKTFKERDLDIRYSDKYEDDSNWITIPLDNVYDGTWREWIDGAARDKRLKEEAEEKAEAEQARKVELEMLKKLKEKYGDVG